jgi:hypothetical protein
MIAGAMTSGVLARKTMATDTSPMAVPINSPQDGLSPSRNPSHEHEPQSIDIAEFIIGRASARPGG